MYKPVQTNILNSFGIILSIHFFFIYIFFDLLFQYYYYIENFKKIVHDNVIKDDYDEIENHILTLILLINE